MVLERKPSIAQIAIGYGRKSFDHPENRTSSADHQEPSSRNYAQQHSFVSSEFLGDNGITGATMERPSLQAALASLKAGKAQVLIIEDVDRLAATRNTFRICASCSWPTE